MMEGFKEKDKDKLENKNEVLEKGNASGDDDEGIAKNREDSLESSACWASPIDLSEERTSTGPYSVHDETGSVGSLRGILKKPPSYMSSNNSSPCEQWHFPSVMERGEVSSPCEQFPFRREMGRGRYLSESCLDQFSWCSKKSVHFSEIVRKQIYRSNSSILGQTAKNKKKAEKKRKSKERRKSEGDEQFDDSGIDTSINSEKEKSSRDDSRLSSSLITESEGEHSLLTESDGDLSILTESSEGECELVTESSEGECELVTTLVKCFRVKKVSEDSQDSEKSKSFKSKQSKKSKRKESKLVLKEEKVHEPVFKLDI